MRLGAATSLLRPFIVRRKLEEILKPHPAAKA